MHKQSRTDLEKIAADMIENADGDVENARYNFREEARMRWDPDDDGPRAAYLKVVDEIFEEAERSITTNNLVSISPDGIELSFRSESEANARINAEFGIGKPTVN